MKLFYDYAASKAYCESIGLIWYGDDYPGLVYADKEARRLELSQYQVDELMKLFLWETKQRFTPRNYTFVQRLMIAFYFLPGWKPK